MRKYNLSKIMKRAWELVKGFGFNISEALKKAWTEAKDMKEQLIAKMEKLAEIAKCDGWHYEVVAKEWNNYGKSRCYLSIIETRRNSKHYAKYDFGYYDNKSGAYVAGRRDLKSSYDLSGTKNDLLN